MSGTTRTLKAPGRCSALTGIFANASADHLITAPGFGVVKCLVGTIQPYGPGFSLADVGDTGAGGHLDIIEKRPRADAGQELVGQNIALLHIGLRQHNHEFFSADTKKLIAFSEPIAQPQRYLLQNLVAGKVSPPVSYTHLR